MTEDYNGAFEKYMDLLKKGGTREFTELVKEAGLENPFCAETLELLSEKLSQKLKI